MSSPNNDGAGGRRSSSRTSVSELIHFFGYYIVEVKEKVMIVRAAVGFLLLATQIAAFSSTASEGTANRHLLIAKKSIMNPKNTVSPLYIGTGFSFNDGNQVLVSVQKPLGIILEQDNNDEHQGNIVVVDMDTSGSAARAGVQVGDILVAVQNASVENQSLEYVLDFIGQAPKVVNLRFVRRNQDD